MIIRFETRPSSFWGNLSNAAISVFFGIIIRIFYRDHSPPHFHAEYQGQNATFDFNGKLLEGEIDSRTAKDLIKKMGTPS